MDWFAATCGGAALYAAGRWLQVRLHNRKAGAGLGRRAGSRRGIPLKAVVANCEAKWFLQELQQAMSGDHTAMVRISHMLLVGYGTRQDEAAAAEWMRKAWAVQNFKEPADRYLQYEMLDFPNSDIPVLNDAQQQQHAAAPTAAAAGAQAAAHLRQLQRRTSSTRGVAAAAAAAAAAEGPPALQSPSPRARAALDGGCSSSSGSSGSSNGTRAGNSAAAGQPGSAHGSATASAVSSRLEASPPSASQTAAASSTQTAQQGGAQPPPQPQEQQQQQRCLQVVELVQQSVAAVHLVTGQGVAQMQQQGAAVHHWSASVQVLPDLRSVWSPCDTTHVNPVKQQGQQQQQQQQQVRNGNTDRAVLLQGCMQGL